MVDTRFCTAGRNQDGVWFIACKEPPHDSRTILRARCFTESLSAPPDQPYDLAARHIRAQGGLFWATNAPDEYTTIIGIPRVTRDG
ncbi:hypothetical protein [Actibacterium sp. D379-3]